MSVDLSHIIKHNFYQVSDKEASRKFVKETIEQLRSKLLIQDEEIPIFYEEEENETYFRLPVYDVEFYLRNGFWEIESYYRYRQIIIRYDNGFVLRRLTYDLAMALGQKEAWYADEFHTWNGTFCEDTDTTFEQWITKVREEKGSEITEYNQDKFIEDGYDDYEDVYHDSFKECDAQFADLKSKFGDYNLLGLYPFGDGFLRCEKNGGLYLINEKTLKPMFNEPITNVSELDGHELLIKKNGLSAVVDQYGKFLTDFVEGKFDWKLANSSDRRIIFNTTAGIELETKY